MPQRSLATAIAPTRPFGQGTVHQVTLHLTPACTASNEDPYNVRQPTGIATGPYGDVYVSNYGVIPGYGQVVKVIPGQ